MKSAYELAMERLEKQHGKMTPLNDAQKSALAEVDRRLQAGLAETDILFAEKFAAASGDMETLRRLEEEKQAAAARIRDRAALEKDAIRRDAGLA